MAKISGINTNLRGQIGDYLFRKTKYGTIVSEAPSRKATPQRTEGQMYVRTQWVNLGAVYRQLTFGLPRTRLGNARTRFGIALTASSVQQDAEEELRGAGEHDEHVQCVCAGEPTNEARAEAKLVWTMPCKEEETRSVTSTW